MTSRILRQLRDDPKFRKPEPPPPPAALDTSALNSAIGELIQQAAAAGAEEAIKKQPYQNPAVPAHRRDFTDKAESHEYPPATPTTAPPKDLTVSLTRNEVGRVHKVSIGKTNFIVQRDGEGRVVRMVQED
ncbi:hypothetical protein [Pseudomonas sp.]|uniref:hypothetical protein n=1 Tax=Pseudomonas sp. TaxID=306 RepID=UPI002FC7ED64